MLAIDLLSHCVWRANLAVPKLTLVRRSYLANEKEGLTASQE